MYKNWYIFRQIETVEHILIVSFSFEILNFKVCSDMFSYCCSTIFFCGPVQQWWAKWEKVEGCLKAKKKERNFRFFQCDVERRWRQLLRYWLVNVRIQILKMFLYTADHNSLTLSLPLFQFRTLSFCFSLWPACASTKNSHMWYRIVGGKFIYPTSWLIT